MLLCGWILLGWVNSVISPLYTPVEPSAPLHPIHVLVSLPGLVLPLALVANRANDIGWRAEFVVAPFIVTGILGLVVAMRPLGGGSLRPVDIGLLVAFAVAVLTLLLLLFWPGQPHFNKFGAAPRGITDNDRT